MKRIQNISLTNLDGKKVRNILIGLYILVILGISASARADVSIYPIGGESRRVEAHNFNGELTVTLDGVAYLIINDKEFYELAPAVDGLDLSAFNGMQVVVNGFELKHKSGPVISVQSMDPLDGETVDKRVAPVLIVFGISECAE